MKKTVRYEGTPQDIGCDVFISHVMPVMREASKGMPQQHLAELYAGFMAGACGLMAADFGKDAASALIKKFAEQVDGLLIEIDQGMMQ